MKFFLSVFFLCSFLYSNSIKAQELTMFNSLFGWEFYQDDNRIERDYFKKLISNVPAAEQSWKKANLNQGIGLGMFGVQIGFTISLLDNSTKEKSLTVPTIGLAVSALSAIVFSIRSMTHRKHAILNYNRSFDRNNIGQRLRPASSGIGIAWSF